MKLLASLSIGATAMALGLTQNPVPVSTPVFPGPAFGGAPDVLDFEGLATGEVVSTVFGASGAGPIFVSGVNPLLPGQNAAIVFDSANPTGEDPDLGTPNETCPVPGPGVGIGGEVGSPNENCTPQGKVLIVAEDLVDVAPADGLIDDPDDAAGVGVALHFDFSALGSVSFCGITLIDVEANEPDPLIVLTFADTSTLMLTLPTTGDNGVQSLSAPCGAIAGVVAAEVRLNGSGAIDDLFFLPDTVECDACLEVVVKCTDAGPGAPIAFIGRVRNCGEVELQNVIVAHDNGTPLDTSDDVVLLAIPLLPPGHVMSFSGSYQPSVPAGTPSTLVVTAVASAPESCGLPDLFAESAATCTQAAETGEGCTPGFWKNHTELWDEPGDPIAAAAGFTTGTSFNGFLGLTPAESGFPDSMTMLQAASLGGGGANKLARHGVPALLNLAAGLDYELPPGIADASELALALQNAYQTDTYEPLASQLADANEAGCPF